MARAKKSAALAEPQRQPVRVPLMASVSMLVPSQANPRRRFDDAALAELTESVRKHGVLQPILVRPDGDGYEIVAGERRWRAALAAGLETIPAIASDLTDREALEIALVENMARADLSPMEEAEALHALAEQGVTAEELAHKVGRSVSYVRTRLRLMDLPPGARDLCAAGKLDISRALLIVKLGPDDAEGAARVLAGEATDDDRAQFLGGAAFADAVESLAGARRFVLSRCAKPLSFAPFDGDDPKLYPVAGTCGACPKNTATQPDLFGTIVDTLARCLDSACWGAKTDAHWTRIEADCKADGKTLLSEAESEAALKYHSGYLDLDDSPDWGYGDADATDKTWREHLGKKPPEIVCARGHDGAPVEMVKRADALALLAKRKVAWAKEAIEEDEAVAKDKPATPRSNRDWQAEHRAAARLRRLEEAQRDAVARAAAESGDFTEGLPDEAEVQAAYALISSCEGGSDVLARRYDDGEAPRSDGEIEATIRAMRPADRRSLIVELLIASAPDEADLEKLAKACGLTKAKIAKAREAAAEAFEKAVPCPTCETYFATGDLDEHVREKHPRRRGASDEEE